MTILDALKNKKKEEFSEEKPAAVKSSGVAKPASAKGFGVAKKEKVSASAKETKEFVKDSEVVNLIQKDIEIQNVLKYPRITEKAAILAEKNAYTFEIDPRANKIDVARAIKKVYNVEPVRVNITKLPARNVVVRGRRGVKSAVKKAIVYLKKGDKIEFV